MQAIPGPLLTGCQHSGHQCPATIKPGFINRSGSPPAYLRSRTEFTSSSYIMSNVNISNVTRIPSSRDRTYGTPNTYTGLACFKGGIQMMLNLQRGGLWSSPAPTLHIPRICKRARGVDIYVCRLGAMFIFRIFRAIHRSLLHNSPFPPSTDT